MFLLAALAAGLVADRASAQEALDPAGLTFRDFAVNDNGASFQRGADPIIAGGPNQVSSRILGIDAANGLARVQFASIRVDMALPLGWQATEDWERGVAYSTDKRFRLIVWRVDFAFEGAKDAEHYAAMKTGSIQARRPTIQARARKLGDGTFLIVYENVARTQGDSETRQVFDLVLQNPGNPKEGILVTLGVPASQAARGLRLLALLKQNMMIIW
jgi:hypothetical protein